jgi:ketosteroid isomerase-like protein
MVFERIAGGGTPDFAFIVEVERFRARLGESGEMVSGALRVTTIFRPEDGTWKVVHRHADSMGDPLHLRATGNA